MRSAIKSISAFEVFDSRGNPTIKCTVTLKTGGQGSFIVPSGASTGTREAVELRDKDETRFRGKGVLNTIHFIEHDIQEKLKGVDAANQSDFDHTLMDLDGTDDKHRLGANALLAVSCATVCAVAQERNQPLYAYLGTLYHQSEKVTPLLPLPLCNIMNGGTHAIDGLDFQEFQIIPHGAQDFPSAIRMCAEVFSQLRDILHEKKLSTLVGDEGGFAPALDSFRNAFELFEEATTRAGYTTGTDLSFGLDVAASELLTGKTYKLPREHAAYTTKQFIKLYTDMCKSYPVVSLEDPLGENDWGGWTEITKQLNSKVEIIGDDLFTTNVKYIQEGIDKKAATAVLVKLNQIGTLTETFDAMRLAASHDMACVISHRSGDSEDTFIADLAVGTACGQIKTGSMSRSERTAKYNRLLEIDHELRIKGNAPAFKSLPH